MALMLDALYTALKAAGTPEAEAREAAREVAAYDSRLSRISGDMALLKWMVGASIALMIGLFWMQWQVLGELADINSRLEAVENRVAAVENRLDVVASHMADVEQRLSLVEGRLGSIEERLPPR